MTDQELIESFDGMYSNGEADVRCYSAKVVRPRKAKSCPGNFAEGLHDVTADKRGIVERALIDGKWRSCFTCEDCIVTWAKERGIVTPRVSAQRVAF